MPVTNLVTVGPGVGLRTGGAKNHRPFNVFLALPDSNPVSRSLFLVGNPVFMRVPGFFIAVKLVGLVWDWANAKYFKPSQMLRQEEAAGVPLKE